MDFRQLEAFIATVDNQSFSAAAEVLYLSQPTISSHIHSLERELHTQLIRRTTKKFEVTPEGRQLYEYAVAMVRLQQKAVNELSSVGMKELHIGTSSVPGQCILPKVLGAYHEIAPEVSFHVVYSDSMEIIHKVEGGTLDLGLVGTKVDSPCQFEAIATDELVIIAPNTAYYRETYGTQPQLTKLLKEPFVIRTEQSGTKLEAEQVLSSLKLSESDLNIVARVNNAEALQNYVAQGLGISLVSNRLVQDQVEQGKLLAFSLEEHARPRKFYLVYQEGPYLPKAADRFIRHLRELSRNKDL